MQLTNLMQQMSVYYSQQQQHAFQAWKSTYENWPHPKVEKKLIVFQSFVTMRKNILPVHNKLN